LRSASPLSPPPIDRRAARRLTLTLLVLGLAATLVGALQHLAWPMFRLPWNVSMVEGGLLRAPSLFEHPNDFGYLASFAALIAFGALLANGPSAAMGVVAALLAAGVALSVSRSSYLALALAAGLGALSRGRRALGVLLVVAVSLAALAGPMVVRGVQARVEKIARAFTASSTA
jgi:hypothetical protein